MRLREHKEDWLAEKAGEFRDRGRRHRQDPTLETPSGSGSENLNGTWRAHFTTSIVLDLFSDATA